MSTTASPNSIMQYEPLPVVTLEVLRFDDSVEPESEAPPSKKNRAAADRPQDRGRVLPEDVDLPTIQVSRCDWQPCTHVQLPSGKLLRCNALVLGTCCEALKEYELAGHIVRLDYPASCDFQDDDVSLFFDALHEFQCTGGHFPTDAWDPNCFFLIATLECSALYVNARNFLKKEFDRFADSKRYDDDSFWDWLSVSRHSFLEFDEQRGPVLERLNLFQVRVLLRHKSLERFVRCAPFAAYIDLAVGMLSRSKTLTIRYSDQPEIVVPSFGDLEERDIAELVEEQWGIPRSEFDWTALDCSALEYSCSSDNRILVLERSELRDVDPSLSDQDAATEDLDLVESALEPAAQDDETSTVFCDAVLKLPEPLRVVVVAGELKIVCRRDQFIAIGGLLREILEELDGAPMHEIPLPGLAEYEAADVIEFFQRLHDGTLCDMDDDIELPVHWRPSWVHIVRYLQMEPLLSFADQYVEGIFWTGRCCSSLKLFCDCVEACKLSCIGDTCQGGFEEIEATTAKRLHDRLYRQLLQIPAYRFEMLLHENDRKEVATRFEKAFGDGAHVIFARFIAAANERNAGCSYRRDRS